MSTFEGVVEEFPDIRIDRFTHAGKGGPLAYFLSHVHTDHTQGLETYRSPAAIYCSAATKALLLRMEKYPSRVNYDRGILEAKQRHFQHLQRVLRPLPLHTPCEIHLTPQRPIRVTLFDANHCPGAVMFLIEDHEHRILYTGDIRAEPWWVEWLMRVPAMAAYAARIKILDSIYLDTTYATSSMLHRSFPSKTAGIQSLIQKIAAYDENTVFHLKAWTLGYEEVFAAIVAVFSTKIHVERYKGELYHSLRSLSGCVPHAESPTLNGFDIGSLRHDGALTNGSSRFHICDPECEELDGPDIIRILPVVSDLVQEPAARVKFIQDVGSPNATKLGPNQIVYAYARHSSYDELRALVGRLGPKQVHACVFDEQEWNPEQSMEALFGDLCSGTSFTFDRRQRKRHLARMELASLLLDPIAIEKSQSQSLSQVSSIIPGSEDTEEEHSSSLNAPAKRLKSGFTAGGGTGNTEGPRLSYYSAHTRRKLGIGTATSATGSLADAPMPSATDEEAVDSQLTLPDTAFASQTSQPGGDRVAARQAAYRAARRDDGARWADFSPLRPSHIAEDVEL